MNFSCTPPNSSSGITFEDYTTPPLTTPSSLKYQSPISVGGIDTPQSLMFNFNNNSNSDLDQSKKRSFQQQQHHFHHDFTTSNSTTSGHINPSSRSCDLPTINLPDSLGPPFMQPDESILSQHQTRPDMKRRRTEPNIHPICQSPQSTPQSQLPAGTPSGLTALGLDVKGATSGVTPSGMIVLPESRNDEVWPPEVDEAFYEGK